MHTVPKGTKVDRSETIDGSLVTKPVVTENHATKAFYSDVWQLDFANVTESELLTLATRTVVIDLQGKFRKAKGANVKDWAGLKVSVRKHLDSKRQRKTAAEKYEAARQAARQLTKEDLLAELKRLEADEGTESDES